VNSAVKRLREALNDSADNPRFVETLPRLGYRYIGPSVVHPEGSSATDTAPASATPAVISSPEEQTATAADGAVVTSVSNIREEVRATPRRQGTWAIVAAVSLCVLVVAEYFVRRSRMRPVLTETDLVLVSDFVNTTGDPVYDGSLKRALAVKLGESPRGS
jgi:eukaryotic-like serine/threonine-protein kinase